MPGTARRSKREESPLTKSELLCMEAYYALLQGWRPDELGSEEIRRWIRECRNMRPPSNTTVLLALKKTGVPHRSAGKPIGGRARLEQVAAPFLPLPRRTGPR
jgi:hypothetical protein